MSAFLLLASLWASEYFEEIRSKNIKINIINMKEVKENYPDLCDSKKGYKILVYLVKYEKDYWDLPDHTLLPLQQLTNDPRDQDVTEDFLTFLKNLLSEGNKQ